MAFPLAHNWKSAYHSPTLVCTLKHRILHVFLKQMMSKIAFLNPQPQKYPKTIAGNKNTTLHLKKKPCCHVFGTELAGQLMPLHYDITNSSQHPHPYVIWFKELLMQRAIAMLRCAIVAANHRPPLHCKLDSHTICFLSSLNMSSPF